MGDPAPADVLAEQWNRYDSVSLYEIWDTKNGKCAITVCYSDITFYSHKRRRNEVRSAITAIQIPFKLQVTVASRKRWYDMIMDKLALAAGFVIDSNKYYSGVTWKASTEFSMAQLSSPCGRWIYGSGAWNSTQVAKGTFNPIVTSAKGIIEMLCSENSKLGKTLTCSGDMSAGRFAQCSGGLCSPGPAIPETAETYCGDVLCGTDQDSYRPWDGGGGNIQCGSGNYLIHAYTHTVLKNLMAWMEESKYPEPLEGTTLRQILPWKVCVPYMVDWNTNWDAPWNGTTFPDGSRWHCLCGEDPDTGECDSKLKGNRFMAPVSNEVKLSPTKSPCTGKPFRSTIVNGTGDGTTGMLQLYSTCADSTATAPIRYRNVPYAKCLVTGTFIRGYERKDDYICISIPLDSSPVSIPLLYREFWSTVRPEGGCTDWDKVFIVPTGFWPAPCIGLVNTSLFDTGTVVMRAYYMNKSSGQLELLDILKYNNEDKYGNAASAASKLVATTESWWYTEGEFPPEPPSGSRPLGMKRYFKLPEAKGCRDYRLEIVVELEVWHAGKGSSSAVGAVTGGAFAAAFTGVSYECLNGGAGYLPGGASDLAQVPLEVEISVLEIKPTA